MVRRRLRWFLVVAVVAGLAALPELIARLPVAVAASDTATLLKHVRSSGSIAYSGYAESLGTLAIPAGPAFSNLTDLFGTRTRMRIWWRAPLDWRVDVVKPAGEQGIYRNRDGAWLWDFERDRATQVDEPAIRLPTPAELVPAELGRRLLSEARPNDVRRLPARRIAGHAAAGVRLEPSNADATVGRVDMWADPRSGLPLRVEVWGRNAQQPALQSEFLDLRFGRPVARTTTFVPPAGAEREVQRRVDVAELARRYGGGEPPDRLIGLPLRHDADAVGTYGRGPVFVAAVPLPAELEYRLSGPLSTAPGAQVARDGRSTSLAVGPLSLLVGDVAGQPWLLTGTVSVTALRRALGELAARRAG